MRIPRSIILVAVGVIAGATITAGAASAISAGASNPTVTYYGCVSTRGTLSKVGSTAPKCSGKSTLIAWNSFSASVNENENGSETPVCTGIIHAGIDLSGCNLYGVLLGDANLTGANFSEADLTDSDGAGVNLSNGNLAGTNLQDGNLFDANLTDADLANATLSNVQLSDANMTGANLSGANLTGDYWGNTTCPDGTNSNNDGGTCVNNLTP
jgi:hypothetical protein